MKRTESVSEYLARGGKIVKLPSQAANNKIENVKSTSVGGPAVIMTMDEADLFYGEQKIRKSTKKSAKSIIDLSALPEELRRKYVDEVICEEEDED